MVRAAGDAGSTKQRPPTISHRPSQPLATEHDPHTANYTGSMGEAAAADRIRLTCETLVGTLTEHGHAPEPLAIYRPPWRRFGFIPVAATMRPVTQVWPLGVLLLDIGAGLWVAGKTTRAAERPRPSFQAVSVEERRDLAAAALRGGFAAGTTVHFDAVPLVLDDPTGPHPAHAPSTDTSAVGWYDGAYRVRWRAGATLDGAPTLIDYLGERVSLLLNPPQRSTD